MKEEILKLYAQGLTFGEIAKKLKIKHQQVFYHCRPGEKEKTRDRQKKYREKNKLLQKLEVFKDDRRSTKFYSKVSGFQDKGKASVIKYKTKDVLEKFSENTNCYLTGEKINLITGNYHLDHIIPVSRGGENSLDNMGVLTPTVNMMKGAQLVDELLENCKKILEYNGYKVIKIIKE